MAHFFGSFSIIFIELLTISVWATSLTNETISAADPGCGTFLLYHHEMLWPTPGHK
jgi:hypothetical protein